MTGLQTGTSGDLLLQEALDSEQIGDWASADRLYGEAFEQGREESEVLLLIRSTYGSARVRRVQGRLEESEELAEVCCRMAAGAGLEPAGAWALNGLAAVRFSQNRWTEARELFARASEMARAVGDEELIGQTAQNLGIIANILGDLPEARNAYLEGVASSTRSGDKRTTMMAYNNLGMVCTDLQEWLEAEVCFDRGIEIAEDLGDSVMLAKLLTNRAEPLLQVGELDRAWAALNRAETLASWTGDAEIGPVIARYRGLIALRKGNCFAAAQHLTQALAMSVSANRRLDRAEVLEALSTVRWAAGDASAAIATLREARGEFAALGMRAEATRAEARLDEWGAPATAS